MVHKKMVFITIGILLNVLLCLGLYANYKLDYLVAGLNKPGVLYRDKYSESGEYANDPSLTIPGASGLSPSGKAQTNTPGTPAYSPNQDSSRPSQISPPSKQDLATGVEQKLGRTVEKQDLIDAGIIVLRRLNWDEITFLYNVGSKAQQNPEELQQAREILRGKLSADELDALRAFGGKYGQSLRFLD